MVELLTGCVELAMQDVVRWQVTVVSVKFDCR
jgi:hypothetical protein